MMVGGTTTHVCKQKLYVRIHCLIATVHSYCTNVYCVELTTCICMYIHTYVCIYIHMYTHNIDLQWQLLDTDYLDYTVARFAKPTHCISLHFTHGILLYICTYRLFKLHCRFIKPTHCIPHMKYLQFKVNYHKCIKFSR